MANIKELKKKIKGTKQTLKITSAMKLVSAAKMTKAQQAITSARPYVVELENSIKTIAALATDYEHTYLKENGNNKALLLVISADKGLCGGYNSQLAKKVMRFIEETEHECKVMFIGKKVREVIEKKVNAGKTYSFSKKEPSFAEIQIIGEELAEMFKTGEVGKVFIAYNVFQSAMVFIPTVKQILPIGLDLLQVEKLQEEFPFDFKYDPNPSVIMDALIPEVFLSTLYTSLLDALAAEHGSRMTAMESASGNCKDAIKSLTINMNKLRQAAITTELIEVVSGAESLNS